MRNALVFSWLSLAVLAVTAGAQQTTIVPQVRTKPTADNKITSIELAAHFVTAIRVPEPVNSVVVGDPALFQVEHSEHEPELVFVKALTNEHAESNLLISTARGRQISFLLVSGGVGPNSAKVDFLLRYQPSGGFLVEPDAVPFALVAQTASVSKAQAAIVSSVASPSGTGAALLPASLTTASSPVEKVPTQPKPDSLDGLLERQKQAPMPVLYGERPEGDEVKGDRLRAGISKTGEVFTDRDEKGSPVVLERVRQFPIKAGRSEVRNGKVIFPDTQRRPQLPTRRTAPLLEPN